MAVRIDDVTLGDIATGFDLLGSGGGGSTALLERIIRANVTLPIDVMDVTEVDPDALCIGAAFVGGGAVLMSERIPGLGSFDHLTTALARWLGEPASVVCSLEGGGLNALVPLLLQKGHILIDADLTGRAVASHEQMSILVDGVPGVVAACDLGSGGFTLVDAARTGDFEALAKFAALRSGGVGGIVFSGFRVRDLISHSMAGSFRRAKALGAAFRRSRAATLPELADALGAESFGRTSVTAVRSDVVDPRIRVAELRSSDGEIARLVGITEHSALLVDGELRASSPEIFIVLDSDTRRFILLEEIAQGMDVEILVLPGPQWWSSTPQRLHYVLPSYAGMVDLDRRR